MERLTRGRVIVDIDGVRKVYIRNRAISSEEEMDTTIESINNMSIEGNILILELHICFY